MQVTRENERAYTEWKKYVKSYNEYLEENTDDEEFIDDYWCAETAAFGWNLSAHVPNVINLVYELATGGPNAHLVFSYKIDVEEAKKYSPPDVELLGIEFQFHWWSPVSRLNLTKIPKGIKQEKRELYETAHTILEQIQDEAMIMLDKNSKEILK